MVRTDIFHRVMEDFGQEASNSGFGRAEGDRDAGGTSGVPTRQAIAAGRCRASKVSIPSARLWLSRWTVTGGESTDRRDEELRCHACGGGQSPQRRREMSQSARSIPLLGVRPIDERLALLKATIVLRDCGQGTIRSCRGLVRCDHDPGM